MASLESLSESHPDRAELLQFALSHLKRKKQWPACLKINAMLRAAGVAVADVEMDKYAQTAAYAHLKRGEKAQMIEVVKQFSRQKAQLEFLEEAGESTLAIDLMLEWGQRAEALDLMLATSDSRAEELATELADRDAALLARCLQARASAQAEEAHGVILAHDFRAAAQGEPRLDHDRHLVRLFALDGYLSGGKDGLAKQWVPAEASMPFPAWQLMLFRLTINTCRQTLDLTALASTNGVRKQWASFLRLRSQPLPRQDMPTWCWLCDAAAHDPTQLLSPQTGDFIRLLGRAVQGVAARWMRHAPRIFAACTEQLLETYSAEPSWSRKLCQVHFTLIDVLLEFRLLVSRRPGLAPPLDSFLQMMPSNRAGGLLPLLFGSLVAMLYSGETITALPLKRRPLPEGVSLHFSAAEDLKRGLAKRAQPFMLWLFQTWFSPLRPHDLHWDLSLIALLFKLLHKVLGPAAISGLNHLKLFADKVVWLEDDARRDSRAQREGLPRFKPHYRSASTVDRSPGRLLLLAASLTSTGVPGNLAKGLQCYVDFLHLSADYYSQAWRNGTAASLYFKAPLGLCVDVIECICASTLLVFAHRTQQRLMLPESMALRAFSLVDFAEVHLMQQDQIKYLHTRFRNALDAIQRLWLLDSKSMEPLVRDRAILLCLTVYAASPIAGLHAMQRMIVKPLLAEISEWRLRQAAPIEPSSALWNALDQGFQKLSSRGEDYNLPLLLHEVLIAQYDRVVWVSLAEGGTTRSATKGPCTARIVQAVTEEQLQGRAAAFYPTNPRPLVPSSVQRSETSKPLNVSNAFSMLEQEEQEAEDEAEAKDEVSMSPDVLDDTLLAQERRDAAATTMQSHVRAKAARRKAREETKGREAAALIRQQLRKQRQMFDDHVEDLRTRFGPSAALEAYSQRLKRFEPKQMHDAGKCLYCGKAWGEGHVDRNHFTAKIQFESSYFPFIRDRCAPLLMAMDDVLAKVRTLRKRSPDLSEEGAQQVFEIRSEMEDAQAQLQAALEFTEDSCSWEAPKAEVSMLVRTTEMVRLKVTAASEAIGEGTTSVGGELQSARATSQDDQDGEDAEFATAADGMVEGMEDGGDDVDDGLEGLDHDVKVAPMRRGRGAWRTGRSRGQQRPGGGRGGGGRAGSGQGGKGQRRERESRSSS